MSNFDMLTSTVYQVTSTKGTMDPEGARFLTYSIMWLW